MEDTRLTANFTLAELTKTSTGIPNQPPSKSEIYSNLLRTAKMLQSLRDWLGKPIIVNSGYRSPAVNKAVGGASNSSHMYGLAADIWVKGLSPVQLAAYIDSSDIAFDKLIVEPTWVHLQVAREGEFSGQRIMWAEFTTKGVRYHDGMPPDNLYTQPVGV